ncbi:MAG: universal stress protein, partial [Saprospiraceae bacterium]|nr:universal stress protein [Saprospiraceae bacterium]
SKIVEGKTINRIVDETKIGRHGLVVVGHRKALLTDEIPSCTVEKIMRHCQVPVLSISAVHDIKKIKHIVFATDLETTPVYVVKQLGRLQHALQAKLHIVKINTREDWISSREAQDQFDRFQEIQKLSNFEFVVYNDKTAEEGIQHYASDIGAGLIAMGIHNARPGDKLLDHHIAEDVLKKSPQILWTCTT